MHIDPYIVLGSAIVGLLVGMTGAGGGALMTPMLILLFGIKPSTAISSDLVAAVLPSSDRNPPRQNPAAARAQAGRPPQRRHTRGPPPSLAGLPGPAPLPGPRAVRARRAAEAAPHRAHP